jgi:hypothetical protein
VAENPLDLGDLSEDPKYDVRIESNEEAAARRLQVAEKAKHKRLVNLIILIFALLMVLIIFVGCIYEFATGSVDDKKWAGAIVASICSAFLGFVGGQRLD